MAALNKYLKAPWSAPKTNSPSQWHTGPRHTLSEPNITHRALCSWEAHFPLQFHILPRYHHCRSKVSQLTLPNPQQYFWFAQVSIFRCLCKGALMSAPFAMRNRPGITEMTQDTNHLVSHAFCNNTVWKQNSSLVSKQALKDSYEGYKTYGSS